MNFIIAIDGPVASGKGTVARNLARIFGIVHLDTGSIYRMITVGIMEGKELDKIDVDFSDKKLMKRIRDNEISVRVPEFSRLPEVREKVRQIQQEIAKNQSLVCEGRDITSVVFPNARFKFYIDASVKERAKRRAKELECEVMEIEKQIRERDKADMTREESPLVKVKGAVVINASKIDAVEVTKRIEKIVTRELQKGANEI